MKRLRIVLGLLATALSATQATGDQLRNVQIGQEIPSLAMSTVAGKELRSDAFRGRVVVFVYLSAEQRSSEKAAQIASSLAREFRDEKLAVAFLTADVTRAAAFRDWRLRFNMREPLGLDVGRAAYGALGLIVLPTTIVVDAEGRLAHVISSLKSDYERVLRSYVRHTLGLIDDETLAAELTTRSFQRNRPDERVARHRAAARLLRKSGLWDDAERELAVALEIEPDHADTLLDLATLQLAREQPDAAQTLVDRVMASTPNHRRAKLVSGAVAFHRGRFEEAQTILEEALLLNPDPIWTHYYLGLTSEQSGDAAAANAHFKEALARLLKEHPM